VENLKLIRLASNPEPWKTKLDEIFAIARNSLIFDNLAIYGPELDAIPSDVIYAKSIGRGKAAEADVTWGSAVISRVLKEKQIIIDTPQDVHGKDRLELAYILGLPISFPQRSPRLWFSYVMADLIIPKKTSNRSCSWQIQ